MTREENQEQQWDEGRRDRSRRTKEEGGYGNGRGLANKLNLQPGAQANQTMPRKMSTACICIGTHHIVNTNGMILIVLAS